MASTDIQLIRQLRVAFSATELSYLQSLDAFRNAMLKTETSPEALRDLIRLGGALLKDRDRRNRQLGDSPRKGKSPPPSQMS